jgi:hypothetical protein
MRLKTTHLLELLVGISDRLLDALEVLLSIVNLLLGRVYLLLLLGNQLVLLRNINSTSTQYGFLPSEVL